MNTGAVRQRRDAERGIRVGAAGHQVAEMVGDDEAHMAMRQHPRLRPPSGARGEEEPAGIIIFHIRHGRRRAAMRGEHGLVILAPRRRADADRAAKRRRGRDGGGVIGEVGAADHRRGPARLRQIGDLLRGLPEVGRHPDRAHAETGEHRLEHLVAVLALHQHAVALGHAARCQRRRQRIDPGVEIMPGPEPLAPDEADLLPVPAAPPAAARGTGSSPACCRGRRHP